MPPKDKPPPSRSRTTTGTSTPLPRSPSLRLPASLRRPPAPRNPSNPHISLIFADPNLSHGGQPSRPGTLASEDALSRQLDGDAGGRLIGLRSRRSSSATVRTLRSTSGAGIEEGKGSRAESVTEEDEEGDNQAGPSRPKTVPNGKRSTGTTSSAAGAVYAGSPTLGNELSHPPLASSSDTGDTLTIRRLNPKESSSWLRWNSPAPSFPRSRASSILDQGVGGKGKGKGRDVSPESLSTTRNALPALGSSLSPGDAIEGGKAQSEPLSHDERNARTDDTVPPGDPSGLLAPPPASTTEPPSTPRRSWWSRAASPTPKARSRPPDNANTVTPQPSKLPQAIPPSDPAAPTSVKRDSATKESAKENVPLVPPPQSVLSSPDLPRVPNPTPAKPETLDAADPSEAASAPTNGWRAYLWGTTNTAPPAKEKPKVKDVFKPGYGTEPAVPGAVVSTISSKPVPLDSPQANENSANAGSNSVSKGSPEAVSTEQTGAPLEPPASNASATSSATAAQVPAGVPLAIQDHVQEPKAGWGGYLYSFVTPVSSPAPPPPSATPARGDQTARSNLSVQASTEQQPQQSAPESVIPQPETTQPSGSPKDIASTTTAPTSTVDPGLPVPPPSSDQVLRKVSTASTAAGWLGYLSYRSTQKRITHSIEGVEGRKSVESNGEEIMDFSNDPEFPNETASERSVINGGGLMPPAPLTLSAGTFKAADNKMGSKVGDKEKDKAAMPPPKTIPLKSSALSIKSRGKRLSISSTKSGGTHTPLSSSPRTTLLADTSKPSTTAASGGNTTASSPKPNANLSALPGQPAPPLIQPNLVIPSFSDTFDRPPRSFLPIPPPNTASEAVPKATGGLAWRALSVAGSFVYGSSSPATVGSGKDLGKGGGIVDVETETRGRKEGRMIGANLPRRFGLEGGDTEEGWKGVKRVVVVGVHGWFPAKMLHSVIGEPTGTSQKFANMMGAAVKRFFDERGVEDIRLTLMPLEGEGTIDSRVDKLYKAYLSNPAWINDLRRADAIFFAAHSQGCIVTTHLLSRMIAQGHIRTPFNAEAVARCEWAFGPIGVVPPETRRRPPHSPYNPSRTSPSPSHPGVLGISGSDGGYQRVCMLAMCGVHLGPLQSLATSSVVQPYLQWFENAAARELFEFQDSASAVSAAYQKALGMVLENGVRMLLLASLNDQVVPIYGASFSTASHPLLLRALFVDGASYSQTDFMTNLLCFAFMLRNAGLDDQRLIEHLSDATAGSLTGLGHSIPYEEPSTFSLAVDYLLLSAPISPTQPVPELRIEPFSARDVRNDFEIPWIMRALVDSPEVKDLFPGELRDMKEGIVHWKPVTKALKEMKRKLEPMAGRQSRLRSMHNSPSSTSVNTMGEPANVGSLGVRGKESLAAGLKRDW